MPILVKPVSLLLVFVCALGLAVAKTAATPPPAQAGVIPGIPGLPDPCDLIPDATARKICKAAEDPTTAITTVIGAIPGVPNIPSPTDIVGKVAGAAARAIVEPIAYGIASLEADAVSSSLKLETQTVNSTTQVNLTAKWYGSQYSIFLGIAIIIGLASFFGRAGLAAQNQNAAEIGRTGLELLLFLLTGGLLPALIGEVVLYLDNTVAPGFMASGGASANQALDRLPAEISSNLNAITTGGGLILPIIFMIIGIIAWGLMDLMFLFREAMLYLVVAGTIVVWGLRLSGRPAGYDLFGNMVGLLVVLVLFKVIAAFILVIGLGLLGSGESTQPIVLGAVMLALMPFILWGIYASRHRIRFAPLDTVRDQASLQWRKLAIAAGLNR